MDTEDRSIMQVHRFVLIVRGVERAKWRQHAELGYHTMRSSRTDGDDRISSSFGLEESH